MVRPITKRDLLWGYSASVLNIGAGLILLPLILHYLPPEEVGLWFVYLTLAGLAQLLEFGFLPTLTRNAAYIQAGATTLVRDGLPTEFTTNKEVDIKTYSSFFHAAKYIYRRVSLVAFLLMSMGGSLYIYSVIENPKSTTSPVLGWLLFSSGYIVTFYFGYLSAFLQGRGDISQANQMTVLSKSTFTVLAAVGLIAGGGLISVGIASLLSAIIGRLIGLKYFNAHPVSARAAKMTIDLKRNAEAKVLWYNASRLGLVQIGAFLIQRGSTLVASSLLGLTVAGSYGLSNTIVIVLAGVSAVIFQLQVPSFSSLNASGNIESVRKIYAKSLVLSTILFWLGAGVLIFSGEYFLRIIDSKTQLVSVDALLFLVLISFLEMNHSMAATYLTTLNEIPFVKSSLISGIGVLIMSLALTPICGIWGILLSQGIVQMAYNNWKWPSAVSAKLKMTYASLFISGIRLIITKHG